jgi:hypothetical protein
MWQIILLLHFGNIEDAYCSSNVLAITMKLAKIIGAEGNTYTIQWYLLRTITAPTDSDYVTFNESNIEVSHKRATFMIILV